MFYSMIPLILKERAKVECIFAWLYMLLHWVDFKWGWASVIGIKKGIEIPKKKKKNGIAEIWKFAGIWKMLQKFAFFFFCKIWPISLLLRSSSGCSGFRDANSPMSSFENGNLSPTDWTFSSGWNRIDVGQFGWVVGL